MSTSFPLPPKMVVFPPPAVRTSLSTPPSIVGRRRDRVRHRHDIGAGVHADVELRRTLARLKYTGVKLLMNDATILDWFPLLLIVTMSF